MAQGSSAGQEFLDHTAELRTGAELGISIPTLLRPAVERLETCLELISTPACLDWGMQVLIPLGVGILDSIPWGGFCQGDRQVSAGF